ncbi:MAG: diguanylate cyclase [Phycisphaeraceae bacterium]|nr:diguanylate cyclase [Phycisphaeraceae bacterium]MBX3407458.1 diguanylate cyclase [Phycisphaeraceae bacterium]
MSNNENKPLVLLIDDSIDVHRLLSARLRHEPVRLVSLTRGVDGLEHVRRETPSVILLDLDMPDMDGFEVLRALKDDQATNNIPVIVLSGLHGSEDKVTAFDLGATDYVTKPFDLAELRARLRAALRLDRLLKLLAERADVDGLTGLGNRAHFNKRWAEKVAECRRYGHALSLAMIDIDLFKKVNDTFGHPAGDEVIQGVARLLQTTCRSPDVPCRFGGEEFALIMPNTGPRDAEMVVERLREAMEQIEWPRHPDHRVTLSAGLVGSDSSCGDVTCDQWLERADQNLYAAKHGGRNRVVASDIQRACPLTKAA